MQYLFFEFEYQEPCRTPWFSVGFIHLADRCGPYMAIWVVLNTYGTRYKKKSFRTFQDSCSPKQIRTHPCLLFWWSIIWNRQLCYSKSQRNHHKPYESQTITNWHKFAVLASLTRFHIHLSNLVVWGRDCPAMWWCTTLASSPARAPVLGRGPWRFWRWCRCQLAPVDRGSRGSHGFQTPSHGAWSILDPFGEEEWHFWFRRRWLLPLKMKIWSSETKDVDLASYKYLWVWFHKHSLTACGVPSYWTKPLRTREPQWFSIVAILNISNPSKLGHASSGLVCSWYPSLSVTSPLWIYFDYIDYTYTHNVRQFFWGTKDIAVEWVVMLVAQLMWYHVIPQLIYIYIVYNILYICNM